MTDYPTGFTPEPDAAPDIAVVTVPSVAPTVEDSFGGLDAERRKSRHWTAPPPEADPIETEIRAHTDEVALANEYTLRRQRRALVSRLVEFVRVEQLKLAGRDEHTSAEELVHDAVMRALDLYFAGRLKRGAEGFSTAVDTLELMRTAGFSPHSEPATGGARTAGEKP